MDRAKLIKEYLPMSETAYYMLLALDEPRHGYGMMRYVEALTKGRIKLGAGTIYGTLTRMEGDGLIVCVAEQDRRKIYRITAAGDEVLRAERRRIEELHYNGNAVRGKIDG